jgi:hypothetical protein
MLEHMLSEDKSAVNPVELQSRSQVPISSIKVEVKKKHFCAGWSFSCFSAHWMEQDLF